MAIRPLPGLRLLTPGGPCLEIRLVSAAPGPGASPGGSHRGGHSLAGRPGSGPAGARCLGGPGRPGGFAARPGRYGSGPAFRPAPGRHGPDGFQGHGHLGTPHASVSPLRNPSDHPWHLDVTLSDTFFRTTRGSDRAGSSGNQAWRAIAELALILLIVVI
ncbi:MAG: hypothetical protein B7X11_02020 [Acidobacteria bacterium 37-65-4]|nr:MAG: hypothetical protein B7X11_02020 [Acidobacteria bacterium 37-65-4]